MFFQLKRYWEAGGLHANKWRGPASHCCLWTWSVRSTAVDGDPLGLVTYSFSCDWNRPNECPCCTTLRFVPAPARTKTFLYGAPFQQGALEATLRVRTHLSRHDQSRHSQMPFPGSLRSSLSARRSTCPREALQMSFYTFGFGLDAVLILVP